MGVRSSVTVGARVAVAAFVVLALPEPAFAQPMPVVEKSAPTREGWDLTVRLDNEDIRPQGGLSATAFSREAVVTLSATGHIGGEGTWKIQQADLTAGYQLGCQTNLQDGVQLGGGLTNSTSVGANQGVNTDGGVYGGGQVNGQGSGGSGGGQGGGSGGVNGGAQANVGANAGTQQGNVFTPNGFIQTQLLPGMITDITMGSSRLRARTGFADLTDVYLKIDACGGPAAIRSFAKLKIRTDAGTSEVVAYGQPLMI